MNTQPPAWDVFISHAHEDKDIVVRPLAHLLAAYGLEVWFDDFSLRLGDPLRASLDKGLTGSRFGVVVLSKAFLAKKWTKFELDSLIQREQPGEKLILPLLFDIDIDELKESSPALADKVTIRVDGTQERLHHAALQILHEVRPDIYGRLMRRRALLEALETHPDPLVTIKIKDLGKVVVPEGPVFQEELGSDLLSRIRLVRACIREMQPDTLEDWIYDFRREPYPYREIRAWERIAATYTEVVHAYPLKLTHRRIVYKVILESSFFDDDLTERHAPLLRALPARVRSLLHERMRLRPPFEGWIEVAVR